MWAVLSTAQATQAFPFSFNPRPAAAAAKPPLTTVSANSLPSHHRSAPPRPDSGLNPKQQKQQARQLSGSDVLWALQQRAVSQTNKLSGGRRNKKKRRELSSSVGENRDDNGVEYKNLRPLNIKSDWGVKLQELEKRLRELSETCT